MKKHLLLSVCFVFALCGNAYCQCNDDTSINEETCFINGNKKYDKGEYPQALYWYEKGIDKQPMFADNYYGASKVFFLSTETVWGVMYGELYMILSDNDSLKAEVSKNLFEGYFSSFSLNKGKTVAQFHNNIIVYSDSFERFNKYPQVFDSLMSVSAKNIRFIDISALATIRQRFLDKINSSAKDFKNPLFAYWEKIIQSGYWQAYNYWLFAYGNNSEAATWIKNNKQTWSSFLKWKNDNPINLTLESYFSRYLME